MIDVETILKYEEISWKEIDRLIENNLAKSDKQNNTKSEKLNKRSIKHIIKKWLSLTL